MVAGNVIRKPSNGSFNTIVDCGPNLMFSALMEARKQHGLLLKCGAMLRSDGIRAQDDSLHSCQVGDGTPFGVFDSEFP